MLIKVGLKRIEKWNSDLEAQVCHYEEEKAEKGQIVFYGPSNFTRWSEKYGVTNLAEDLPGKSGKRCCINRGFGSSCPEHHLYYYSRMVRPLEPKVMVYAPGLGNGTSFGYTPKELFDLAQRVVLYALSDFPELKVYICGLPARYNKPEHLEYGAWLRQFAEETPNCVYLDIAGCKALQAPGMLGPDNVHFSPEGYKVYGEFFREALKEELANY